MEFDYSPDVVAAGGSPTVHGHGRSVRDRIATPHVSAKDARHMSGDGVAFEDDPDVVGEGGGMHAGAEGRTVRGRVATPHVTESVRVCSYYLSYQVLRLEH